jgi:hypothetical protein
MERNWNNLEVTPPDLFLEVQDENGNLGNAYPTYYPFKVGKTLGGKWSAPVLTCEKYWDGGWLIHSIGLGVNNIDSSIVRWRLTNFSSDKV